MKPGEDQMAGRGSNSGWRPTRRTAAILLAGGGLAAACTQVGALQRNLAGPPVVDTSSGKVRGSETSGVHVFKGIAYGASTAPPHRFRAPRPAEPWVGVRECLEYGIYAPQGALTAAAPPRRIAPADLPDSAPRRLIDNGPIGSGPGEDCLVLNLWTPGIDNGRRPVMVWLHGGGFSAGSGASPWYDGTNLALGQDVVVVTINHRLNLFGYLYLGDLGGGEFADASSAGMLDCVLALRWVRENISRFGGDPTRVLIFGESGGGRKTSTLMAMPPAQGLFQRCAVQSGSQLTLDKPEVAMERTEKLLKAVGVEKRDITRLQSLSLDQLLGAIAGAVSETGQFRPVAGAPSTPRHPFHPDAPALSANVPMLIGSNRTEQSVFLGGDAKIAELDNVGLLARLEGWLPKSARADTLSFYRRLHPDARNDELLYMITTDRSYFLDSIIQAGLKSDNSTAPAFYYQFYRESPAEGGRYHVPHASEIPFVFDTLDAAISIGGQPTPESRALARMMSGAWAAFARTGDPNASGLPAWPAYSSSSRPTMILDAPACRLERDPRGEQRKRMQAIGSQQLQGREIGQSPRS